MDEASQLLVFRVDVWRLALPLSQVERVVRAVAITPLPQAPGVVAGVIDVQGLVIPVLDIRRRFGLAGREVELTDAFILTRAGAQRLALIVEEVEGVTAVRADARVEADQVFPGLPWLEGILRLPDGLVLIQDLARFLSLAESRELSLALSA
jgi:purine-binding chemotaxis protein CheW